MRRARGTREPPRPNRSVAPASDRRSSARARVGDARGQRRQPGARVEDGGSRRGAATDVTAAASKGRREAGRGGWWALVAEEGQGAGAWDGPRGRGQGQDQEGHRRWGTAGGGKGTGELGAGAGAEAQGVKEADADKGYAAGEGVRGPGRRGTGH